MRKLNILSIFGTRPEAIKMAPLIIELGKHEEINSFVCVTGQHREMLDQVLETFKIKPDYDLNIMKKNQTLSSITADTLNALEKVFQSRDFDLVLVHGDTSTSMTSALSAFYHNIDVGHVEAGLRTWDIYSPFPEEMNRQIVGRISKIHFSPTISNKDNLIEESITDNIFITGNTVIDALKYTVRDNYKFKNELLRETDFSKRIILVTAHRRENLGLPLINICNAIKRLAMENKDTTFIFPVHKNPKVRKTVYDYLGEMENIKLIEPLEVFDMHNLIARSYMILTDSGGLQEEAPSLGVPVLVLRTETERPEAVEFGTVKLVGIEESDIYDQATLLLNDSNEYKKMQNSTNPYGSGDASEKIVEAIKSVYNL